AGPIPNLICMAPGRGAVRRDSSREPAKDHDVKIRPKDRTSWRRWFAWHPVIIDNVTVWLEIVERRRHPDIFDWVYTYLVIDRTGARRAPARWRLGLRRLFGGRRS